MKILILGGTQFLGRHLVEAALDAGHDVTLFNRGQTNPGIYPAVEEIHGDRFDQLDRLAGRTWDVVFDPSGYVPRIVRKSAEFLQDAVGRYVFVSSLSVYGEPDHTSEGDPVRQLDDPLNEDVSRYYGELKVACETAVTEIYGSRGLNVRPGSIVGQYDVTPRMPFLLRRFDTDGERIAGRAEQPTQLIHARDLANWMLGAVEQELSGEYNLTGHTFLMQELLDTIITATRKNITLTYVGDDFLLANEIRMQDGITYWLSVDYEPLRRTSIQKALATGLNLMPLPELIEEVLTWVRQTPSTYQPLHEAVVTSECEAELLTKWHEQQGQSS